MGMMWPGKVGLFSTLVDDQCATTTSPLALSLSPSTDSALPAALLRLNLPLWMAAMLVPNPATTACFATAPSLGSSAQTSHHSPCFAISVFGFKPCRITYWL